MLDAAPTTIPWDVFQFVLTSGVALYAWISRRDSAHHADVEVVKDEARKRAADLEHELGALREKHTQLAERVHHLPTVGQVHEVTVLAQKVLAEVQSLGREVGAISKRFELYEEFTVRRVDS